MKKKLFQANASAIPCGTPQRNTRQLLGLGLAIVLLTTTFASPSSAYPEYPNAVREAASMSCTPSCTLCHIADPGTAGTSSKSFAAAMKAANPEILGGDPDSIAIAYAALSDTEDSDADGTPDKQELEDQMNLPSDPNNGDSALGNGPTICAGEVLYGCGAQIATSKEPQPFAVWSLLLAVGGGVVWRLRRGRIVTKLKN